MGLFSRRVISKHDGPLALTQQQAFAAVCIVAVAADGAVEDKEVARVVGNLAERRMFRSQSLDDLGRLLADVSKTIHQRGRDEVMEAARVALAPTMRETVFAVVTDLMLTDGEMHVKEQQFIDDFRKALGIEDALAQKITEVLVIKNRG
jgi:tellurite resistance protein